MAPKASEPNYASRRRKLIRSLKKQGVKALLISTETNVRYLTGFTGDSSWLLISADNEIILSDTRYTTQIQNECEGLEVVIRDSRSPMADTTADVVQKVGASTVGFESGSLSYAQWKSLSEKVASAELVETEGMVEQLRMIKDKGELAEIRTAVQVAQRGINVMRSSMTAQHTEQELRYILEAAMRSFGANGTAFEPIIGVGPTGALPHAHAGHLTVDQSPMLLTDWGAAMPSGYRSDITRVCVTAKPTKQMEKVYNVVLQAQLKAIKAMGPGVKCSKVDEIARKHIDKAGFGAYFGHGLGHGIGLDIHEGPRLSPISDDTLEPGMVVTVEPGIYLPGQFGVRIEDDILITKDGYEVLSSVPKTFEESLFTL